MIAAMGRCPSASLRLRQAIAGEAIDATQGVGQPVLAAMCRTSPAASACGILAAVTYSVRAEAPRRTAMACVAVRKADLAMPITGTPNSSRARAPRPGRPSGSRSAQPSMMGRTAASPHRVGRDAHALTRKLGPGGRAAADLGPCGGPGPVIRVVCPAGDPGCGSAAAPVLRGIRTRG